MINLIIHLKSVKQVFRKSSVNRQFHLDIAVINRIHFISLNIFHMYLPPFFAFLRGINPLEGDRKLSI